MPYYPYTLALSGFGKEGRRLDRDWSGGIGFAPERPSTAQRPSPKPDPRTQSKRLPKVRQPRMRKGQFRGR